MSVRPSMAAQIIPRVRRMIGDAAGTSQFFTDQDVQDSCDEHIDFVRYEPLEIAPTIINTASTGNQASTIFVEYFSRYSWWEQDVALQAYANGQAWVVVTPTESDYQSGHFWFEPSATEFTAPTVPGQLPPVFATGKICDVWAAAADLLELWSAALASAYDISVDGQSLRRSQLMTAKLTLATEYRRKAKPTIAKMWRPDVAPPISSRDMRLLDSADSAKGGY